MADTNKPKPEGHVYVAHDKERGKVTQTAVAYVDGREMMVTLTRSEANFIAHQPTSSLAGQVKKVWNKVKLLQPLSETEISLQVVTPTGLHSKSSETYYAKSITFADMGQDILELPGKKRFMLQKGDVGDLDKQEKTVYFTENAPADYASTLIGLTEDAIDGKGSPSQNPVGAGVVTPDEMRLIYNAFKEVQASAPGASNAALPAKSKSDGLEKN